MATILWTIIALILVIIGVAASVFAGTTIVKDNTDNKTTAKKHYFYIGVGILLIFVGFAIMYFTVIGGLKKNIKELNDDLTVYKRGQIPNSKSMNIFRRQEQQQAQQYQ